MATPTAETASRAFTAQSWGSSGIWLESLKVLPCFLLSETPQLSQKYQGTHILTDCCFSVTKLYPTFLRPHGLQHTRLPCPLPSLRVCANSCQWCHPATSSSVTLFSFCPQSFQASGSFPMSWLFESCGQSIGASAITRKIFLSASVFVSLGRYFSPSQQRIIFSAFRVQMGRRKMIWEPSQVSEWANAESQISPSRYSHRPPWSVAVQYIS